MFPDARMPCQLNATDADDSALVAVVVIVNVFVVVEVTPYVLMAASRTVVVGVTA